MSWEEKTGNEGCEGEDDNAGSCKGQPSCLSQPFGIESERSEKGVPRDIRIC